MSEAEFEEITVHREGQIDAVFEGKKLGSASARGWGGYATGTYTIYRKHDGKFVVALHMDYDHTGPTTEVRVFSTVQEMIECYKNYRGDILMEALKKASLLKPERI